MEKINAEEEFIKQIDKYLIHFGLQEGDLGKLIGTGAADIKNILALKRVVGFKRGERISNIFGLRYFEFGNPNFNLPVLDKLPTRTQEAITNRKKMGKIEVTKNNKLKLNEHINQALSSRKLEDEFTSEDIWMLLPDEIKIQIKAKRITHLFKQGIFKDKVENTDNIKREPNVKGRGQILYRLK